mmetsp:Transcript_44714/g.103385  ORF Transcript_44714/g.103385 Transcript_44714/m.103385 type:complete len:247 (-) Transcript_44714:892-1632(-)
MGAQGRANSSATATCRTPQAICFAQQPVPPTLKLLTKLLKELPRVLFGVGENPVSTGLPSWMCGWRCAPLLRCLLLRTWGAGGCPERLEASKGAGGQPGLRLRPVCIPIDVVCTQPLLSPVSPPLEMVQLLNDRFVSSLRKLRKGPTPSNSILDSASDCTPTSSKMVGVGSMSLKGCIACTSFSSPPCFEAISRTSPIVCTQKPTLEPLVWNGMSRTSNWEAFETHVTNTAVGSKAPEPKNWPNAT